jgi:hypothetical protein
VEPARAADIPEPVLYFAARSSTEIREVEKEIASFLDSGNDARSDRAERCLSRARKFRQDAEDLREALERGGPRYKALAEYYRGLALSSGTASLPYETLAKTFEEYGSECLTRATASVPLPQITTLVKELEELASFTSAAGHAKQIAPFEEKNRSLPLAQETTARMAAITATLERYARDMIPPKAQADGLPAEIGPILTTDEKTPKKGDCDRGSRGGFLRGARPVGSIVSHERENDASVFSVTPGVRDETARLGGGRQPFPRAGGPVAGGARAGR